MVVNGCLHEQETKTGHCEELRLRTDPLCCGRTTCHSNVCYVISCEYGTYSKTAKSQNKDKSKRETLRNKEYCKTPVDTFYGDTRKQSVLPGRCTSCPTVKKSKFRGIPSILHLSVFLCLLSWLSICEARISRRGDSPRIIGDAKTKITAIAGDTLTLPCAIDGDPLPLTTWKLKGELIDSSRPGFRKHGFDIRIRNVRESDAGTYQCIATNGFGSVQVEVKLIVQAARPPEISPPTKPRFVQPTKMRKRNLSKPVGSSLRLRCKASGSPVPKIEWYKDGNLTIPADTTGGKTKRPNWTYVIRMLSPGDAGQYRCRVWNSAGEIGYAYKVDVVDRIRPDDSPVLIEPHPMNTTVRVGGMTTIQCRVDSVMSPTIKWIKRLDQNALASYGNDLPENIITIEGKHYLILPTQEMLRLSDGSYLNKLVIRVATEQHAGMYICLGANTMGYNYRYAYLKVISDPIMSSLQATHPTLPGNPKPRPPHTKQGSLSLPGIIGVPAGLGVLVVIAVAWYCQKRKYGKLTGAGANVAMSGSDRMSATGSVDTKSSTRSTPIPQESENTGEQGAEHANKSSRIEVNNNAERHHRSERNDGVYTYRHPSPPTAGTPLLTVTEPDDTDYQIRSGTDDDGYRRPTAPPPSLVAPSHAASYYSSSDVKSDYHAVPPPPPPPSQYSASSVSSYPDTMPPQYPTHHHYMHPPHSSASSRRYHHHHHHPSHHHSRGDHYGY